MIRKLLLVLSCLIALGVVIAVPYRSTTVRLLLIMLWLAMWISLVVLAWRRKLLRGLLLLAVPAAVAFIFTGSSKALDVTRLRARFVQRLNSYDGVRYIYGGENHRGIDCSGLVRAGMVRSLFDEGVARANPAMIRSAFVLWWRDTNAIQLGKGGNGATLPLGDGAPSPMNAARALREGDLAVTTSGSHVLAFLGNNRWIEADPDIGRVHVVDLANSTIAEQDVLFVTWRWLR